MFEEHKCVLYDQGTERWKYLHKYFFSLSLRLIKNKNHSILPRFVQPYPTNGNAYIEFQQINCTVVQILCNASRIVVC